MTTIDRPKERVQGANPANPATPANATDPMTEGLSSADMARLMDHEYDGIREYDNPTPGWWHAIFLASVVFSVFYFAFYTFSPMAWEVNDLWAYRQQQEYKRLFGEVGNLESDGPTILKLMDNDKLLAVAQGTFIGNCAACHAKDGGGINGVNLTDDYYKSAKSLTDLYTVISKGAANGAMPSWESRLSKNERVLMAAYVASLRGTTPAAARPPEGEVIPPWGAE